MKRTFLYTSLLLCLLFTPLALPDPVGAADTPKTTRPNIYDESLDGSKQILLPALRGKELESLWMKIGEV